MGLRQRGSVIGNYATASNTSASGIWTGKEAYTLQKKGTWQTPPAFSVSASAANVNEGSSVTFTLSTTGVANGVIIPYTLSGANITIADSGTNILSGNFVIQNGTGTVSISPSLDISTEGNEVLQINVMGLTANVTINDTSVGPDPQFPYVSLLLNGNGTNNSQNNTFLDSSATALTVTRNGNSTQGTFTPYGGNWSVYTSSANSLGFTSSGTGLNPYTNRTFTIEFWINPSSSSGAFATIISKGITSNRDWAVYINMASSNARDISFYYSPSSGDYNVASSAGVITYDVWQHVAVVSDNSAIKIYVNGTQVASGTQSLFNSSNPSTVNIGRFVDYTGVNSVPFIGYISNLRFVTGTALYTTTFTPSTTPLTAISGTNLLICQNSRFVDNSFNNYAVSSTQGTPSVQRFSPFNPSVLYSAAAIGGSGYFDGSGDYLTIPDNPAWDLGSGDFTIESWVYPTASAAQPIIIGQWTSVYSWAMQLSNDGNRYLRGLINYAGINDYVSSTSLQLNAWNHCAFVRESNTVNLYLNGVRVYTTAFSGIPSPGSSAVSVGGDASGNQPFQGYLSSTRVVAGTAVYTGTTYTVPTTPLTAITNTQLLCNFTNAGIIDNSMQNLVETRGDAKISTTQSKFGGSSIFFDGTGDQLTFLNNPLFAFFTGNFTVECWLYPQSSGGQSVMNYSNGQSSNSNFAWEMYQVNGTTIQFSICDSDSATGYTASSTGLSINSWNHIAAVRNGNTMSIYVNGVVGGTTVSVTGVSVFNKSTATLKVSGYNNATTMYTGYIDDLRVTNGYARYTTNFTPTTSTFSGQ